jgi:hypothetical protein
MKISVTQEDINQGKHQSCRECVVALAAKRAFPGRTPNVGYDSMSLYGGRLVAIYKLPPEATRLIAAWENRRKVSPLEFELPEPIYVEPMSRP